GWRSRRPCGGSTRSCTWAPGDGADEAPLDLIAQPPDELGALRAHPAGDPVGQEHLVERREEPREIARILVHEDAVRDAAAEDVGLERLDVLPVAYARVRAPRAERPRRPRPA